MGSGNVVILKRRIALIEDSMIRQASSKLMSMKGKYLLKPEGSCRAGWVDESGSSVLR